MLIAWRYQVTGGNISGPGASDQPWPDMVMELPGEVTRAKMTFDKPGRYVWHCHILSYKDREMMQPYHWGHAILINNRRFYMMLER